MCGYVCEHGLYEWEMEWEHFPFSGNDCVIFNVCLFELNVYYRHYLYIYECIMMVHDMLDSRYIKGDEERVSVCMCTNYLTFR